RSTRALWRRPAGCRRGTGGFALRLGGGAEGLRDTVRRDREGGRRGTTGAPALTLSDYRVLHHGVPASVSIATRRRLTLPPPKIADEDVLRDDTIGLDFVGVDGARCDFRGTNVTTGVPDLDVPRVMHLADDLIGVDTVRVDGVGANLVGLD